MEKLKAEHKAELEASGVAAMSAAGAKGDALAKAEKDAAATKADADKAKTALKAALEKAKADADKIEKATKGLAAEKAKAEKAAKDAADKAKAAKEAAEKVSAAEKAAAAAKAAADKLTKEHNDAKKKLGDATTQVTAMTTAAKSRDAEIADLKRLLAEAEEAAKKLELEIQEARKKQEEDSDSDSDEGAFSGMSLKELVEAKKAAAAKKGEGVEEIDDEPLQPPKKGSPDSDKENKETGSPKSVIAKGPAFTVGCQFESDEAESFRTELMVVRGQMQVLAARLMNLGKQDLVVVSEEDIEEQRKKSAEEAEDDDAVKALALTEDWDDKKNDGTLITPRDPAGGENLRLLVDNLRKRVSELVTKGQAARARILALEGELTAAINEKDSAAQWAQMCHRRAIGSEEAAVFARDDLRKLKQLTRAIRMGEMEAQGEKLDTVRASMRIEELTDKLEAEQEIHEVTKLRLEDADERASAAELRLETEQRKKTARTEWDKIMSSTFKRAGATPVKELPEEEAAAVEEDGAETPEKAETPVSPAPAASAFSLFGFGSSTPAPEPAPAEEAEASSDEEAKASSDEEAKASSDEEAISADALNSVKEETPVIEEEASEESEEGEESEGESEEEKKPESQPTSSASTGGGFFSFLGFGTTTAAEPEPESPNTEDESISAPGVEAVAAEAAEETLNTTTNSDEGEEEGSSFWNRMNQKAKLDSDSDEE